jgi:alanyl-tRNA synthetase
MDRLKQAGYDALNKQNEQSVIVLATVNEEENKVYLLAAITDDLVSKGMKAGELVSVLGRTVGGGGGGQPNLATAGGRFPEKTSEAFEAAIEWIKDQSL